MLKVSLALSACTANKTAKYVMLCMPGMVRSIRWGLKVVALQTHTTQMKIIVICAVKGEEPVKGRSTLN